MQAAVTTPMERRAAWREGARDFLPPLIGVCAWGLVTGVAMAQSSLTTPQAVALSLLAFAGSAQLAALPLIAGLAPVWVTVLTALVVNLRFVIYSAALARPLGHLPLRRRLWLSYLVGDVPFALYMRRIESHPAWPARDAYLSGMCVTNYAAWHLSSLAGLALGASVPRDWGLELAGTLALLTLLIPMVLKRPPTAVGVGVTSVVALLAHGFPAHLGVLVAIVAGVVAALATDWLIGRGRRWGVA